MLIDGRHSSFVKNLDDMEAEDYEDVEDLNPFAKQGPNSPHARNNGNTSMLSNGGTNSGPISNKIFGGTASGSKNTNSFLSKTSLFAKAKSGITGATEEEGFGVSTTEKNYRYRIVLVHTYLFTFPSSG